jgi:hypothetical protein
MKWAVHVAHMGERRDTHRAVMGKSERNRPLGRPRVRGRIILRWIFMTWYVGAWTGLI